MNLYAGNYVVTVTDTNGLTDTVQIAISEPSSALGVSTPASLLKNIDCLWFIVCGLWFGVWRWKYFPFILLTFLQKVI